MIARCSHSTRDRSKFAIQACRTWAAAPVGYSHRVSDHREVARAQLLRNSFDSCWWRGRFCSNCKSSCKSGFGDAGRRGRRFPRRWIVKSCTSFGLVPGRDCFRPRGLAGYYLRGSRGIYPVLTRWTAATYTVAGPTCGMGREVQRNRRKLCLVESGLCGRRARAFCVPACPPLSGIAAHLPSVRQTTGFPFSHDLSYLQR